MYRGIASRTRGHRPATATTPKRAVVATSATVGDTTPSTHGTRARTVRDVAVMTLRAISIPSSEPRSARAVNYKGSVRKPRARRTKEYNGTKEAPAGAETRKLTCLSELWAILRFGNAEVRIPKPHARVRSASSPHTNCTSNTSS